MTSLPRSRIQLTLTALICALLADCRTPTTGSSHAAESAADSYNGFVDLFTKVIGRKPQSESDGNSADLALYDNNQDAMVDKLLASDQYLKEGFFNLHRDRLVLTPYQQTPDWVASQHENYCALTKEMQDVAQQDRSGTIGYWSLLSYQTRWVPLPPALADCLVGTTVAALKQAIQAGGNGGNGGDGTFNPVPPSPLPSGATPAAPAPLPTPAPSQAATVAASCANNLQLLGNYGDYSQTFSTILNALGADQQAKAPLDTPQGATLLNGILTSWITASGQPASDVTVAVATDAKGLPIVTEEHDPAPQSLSCTFADLPSDRSTWQRGPNSNLLVQAKVSPKVVGYMANPFWLARNPTTVKNRYMHRARVAVFSFLCKEVSPAAAALAGGAAQVTPALANYFLPDDIHAQASQACYDCHTTMQPLANFYRALDRFDDPPVSAGNNYYGKPMGFRFFQDQAQELPGGYWTFSEPGHGSFFGTDGVDYDLKGLQGMANNFSDPNFVGPAQCVVNAAWSTLFGSEYAMPDSFKNAMVTVFQHGNANGAPSMTEALRAILKSPYGKAYFSSTQGRPAFEAALASASGMTCSDANVAAGLTVVKQRCYFCHNTHTASGGVKLLNFPDRAVLPLTDTLTQQAFCAVQTGVMPKIGALNAADKASTLCYFKPKTGPTPTCQSAAPVLPDSPAHAVPN